MRFDDSKFLRRRHRAAEVGTEGARPGLTTEPLNDDACSADEYETKEGPLSSRHQAQMSNDANIAKQLAQAVMRNEIAADDVARALMQDLGNGERFKGLAAISPNLIPALIGVGLQGPYSDKLVSAYRTFVDRSITDQNPLPSGNSATEPAAPPAAAPATPATPVNPPPTPVTAPELPEEDEPYPEPANDRSLPEGDEPLFDDEDELPIGAPGTGVGPNPSVNGIEPTRLRAQRYAAGPQAPRHVPTPRCPEIIHAFSAGPQVTMGLQFEEGSFRNMSDGMIRHAVISWVQRIAQGGWGCPELGVISRPYFTVFQPRDRVFEVQFVSDRAAVLPAETTSTDCTAPRRPR